MHTPDENRPQGSGGSNEDLQAIFDILNKHRADSADAAQPAARSGRDTAGKQAPAPQSEMEDLWSNSSSLKSMPSRPLPPVEAGRKAAIPVSRRGETPVRPSDIAARALQGDGPLAEPAQEDRFGTTAADQAGEEPAVLSQADNAVTAPSPSAAGTAGAAAAKTSSPRFLRILGSFVPHVGDSVWEVARKCVFILSALVFLGTCAYLLNDLWLVPQINARYNDEIRGMYTPGATPDLTGIPEDYPFPAGMDDAFKKLYYTNPDIRGWISYPSDASNWYGIDYPVVQTDDNSFYLTHDFYKTQNKNGTLFFDYGNDFSSPDYFNRVTIIYGHNMKSGQMFASLNTLTQNVAYARSAPLIHMNTLYREGDYKVFAILILDEDAAPENSFYYLHTQFGSDAEFLSYVEEMRARSIYDYPVDVNADDELLVLSTCSNSSWVHFKNGRTVVVARRVRDGESTLVDTASITDNTDVIMPLAWYVNQDQTPHLYYLQNGYVPEEPDTTDPTDPANPTDPAAPTDPFDPGDDPDTPVVGPTEPSSDPADPVEPADPSDPTDPTEPEPPDESDTDPDTSDTGSSEPTEPSDTGSDPDDSDPTESDPTATDPTESTDSSTDSTDPSESTDPMESEPTENPDPATEPEPEPSEPEPSDPEPEPEPDPAAA